MQRTCSDMLNFNSNIKEFLIKSILFIEENYEKTNIKDGFKAICDDYSERIFTHKEKLRNPCAFWKSTKPSTPISGTTKGVIAAGVILTAGLGYMAMQLKR